MLVMFEMTLVKQQMRNMREIRNMGNKPFPIQCYRFNKWVTISSDRLLPGDIVSLKSSSPSKSKTVATRPQSNANAPGRVPPAQPQVG